MVQLFLNWWSFHFCQALDMVFSSTILVVKMWRQEHVAQQKETSAITGWLLSFLMPAFQMLFENVIIETPIHFAPANYVE